MATSANVKLDALIFKLVSYLPLFLFRRFPFPYLAFIISNFPGPSEPSLLWDHRILDMMFSIRARPSLPLSLNLISYDGSIHFTFMAHSDFLDGQDQLEELKLNFLQELETMETHKEGIESIDFSKYP